MKQLGDAEGFTLVEMMIGLVIFSLVSTGLYNIFLTGWQSWQFNHQQIDLQQQARIISLKLEQELRQAKMVQTKTSSEVVIKLANDKYKKYCFSAADNRVYYKIISGIEDWPTREDWERIKGESIISGVVDAFEFSYNEEDKVVTISLILTKQSQNYQLRNHKIHLRQAEEGIK
ncbi:PilW family protein [Halanaerobaculum tunisiense]